MRELSPRGGLARILSRGGWTKRIPQSLAKASARRNLAALTLLLTAASTIACGGTTAPAPRTSIVLIVVDSLRADHLGLYGYRRDTSPELERIAARGMVFERAFATSPWTLPTFGSLLSGRYPSAHGAGVATDPEDEDERSESAGDRRFLKLRADVPTAAGMLGTAGFATGALVSNPFLGRDFGLDRGFEHYDRYRTDNADYRRADRAVDEALAWIDGVGEQPFFLLLHIFDPHLDYGAPEPFRGRFTDTVDFDGELPVEDLWGIRERAAEMSTAERDFISAAYDEEVAFADAEIGRFADALRARGADTALIITADHGEELFEHDGFEHGHAMWNELLHVPMVVIGPGVAAGRSDTPVSSIDVLPTILALAGVQPDGPLPGVDLRTFPDGATADRALLAERTLYGRDRQSLIRWPLKLTVERQGVELFDLAADPHELDNLAGSRRDITGVMVAELTERIAALGDAAGVREAQLDPRTLRRLKALGYLR
ncbi:MAG: sulfatase-like hydrolase/transferase [Acidobacteriota bacterium]